MLRTLLLAAVGLMLAACVPVGSDKPLFTRSASSTGTLRHGVWTMPTDKCDYDPSTPITGWPSCANGTVVSDDTLTGGFDDNKPQSLAYVLSPGDPSVIQIQAPPDRKPEDPNYVYAGYEPMRTDEAGRVVEARIWLVFCFEPPKDLKDDRPPKPFAGLTMNKGDGFCRASAPGPVRNAARLSQGMGLDGEALNLRARWLRDGER